MENSKNGLTLHSDALPASWAPELTAVFNQRKPIDISYLDTPQGSEHLRKINSILVKNGLHITIERENNMATLSINLFAPGEDKDSYTLLSLFSLSRPLATNDVPGEILLPEHLNEMVNVARLMGATPEITKPIKEDYLKRMATMKVPLRTKMMRAWDDEIKPSIAHQSAQHIGKELAKACLIALGALKMFNRSKPIGKKNYAIESSHSILTKPRFKNFYS